MENFLVSEITYGFFGFSSALYFFSVLFGNGAGAITMRWFLKEESMLRTKLMNALAITTAIVPFAVQADQSMSVNAKTHERYTQGEAIKEGDLPGGYNKTASYKIEDSNDIFLTANFIYWNLHQDLMRLGDLVTTSEVGSTAFYDGDSKVLFLTPTYKPGFQIGLGLDMKGMDDWNLFAEYTWYQNNNKETINAKSGERFVINPLFSGVVVGADAAVVSAGTLTANLNYHYNNANLMMQRPFYFGKKLLANFGFGLRALWVSQSYSEVASDLLWTPPAGHDFSLSGPVNATNYQKSWSLGPRFAFGSNWLLGYGFRFTGDIAASVLYTRYTSLNSSLVGSASLGVDANLTTSVGQYNTLRAVTETALGMGWGLYFGEEDYYHLDVTANYQFNIYWNQNMYGVVVNGLGSPGNAYLQGLNVGFRFDF